MSLKSLPRLKLGHDPRLRARVVHGRPLFYREGEDAGEDRPPHLRAASGLAWMGSRLAVVQDDAAFLAMVDPRTAEVEVVSLPRGRGGARTFDSPRGNKAHKPDFESCLRVPLPQGDLLLGFGSGSTPARDGVLLWDGREARVIPLPSFYATLRNCLEFSGSELNVEGALWTEEGTLILVQRGNGAPSPELEPVDAWAGFPGKAFLAHLRAPEQVPPPPFLSVQPVELGHWEGVRVTFTDVCDGPFGPWFLGAAEASPDTFQDGEVMGAMLGRLGEEGGWTVLRGEDGGVYRGKPEGLCADPMRPGWFFAVTDADSPNVPALLLEILVEGL